MTPALTGLLVGVACALAHMLLSLLLLRLPGRMSPVARHGVSAIVTHLGGVLAAALLVGPFPYWPAAAVSGFSAVVWLFAFSAVYKSVSLKVLSELARTPAGELPLDTITGDYVRGEFVARTAVMTALGWVEPGAEGFSLTPEGESAARRIAAVQRACGIEKSGLYG